MGVLGRSAARSGPVRVVAVAVWLLVLIASLASIGRNPILGAVDAAEYDQSALRLVECYADLAGSHPECPYIEPMLTGASLPIANGRQDPGQVAADALFDGGPALIGAADRLVATQRDGAWLYGYRVQLRDSTLEPPWISASAQGLGVAVLARAWSQTADTRYLDALIAAARAMPISRDGWPEGLPDGSHVLVGGLNGLLGLWDAWRVTRNPEILAGFDRGVVWLEENIHRYDRDFVILYALGPHADPTSADLRDYSIKQLSVIAAMAGSDSLGAIAREWEWRSSNPGAFRLNLYLHAVAQEPASWLFAALTTVLVIPSVLRRRRRTRTDSFMGTRLSTATVTPPVPPGRPVMSRRHRPPT